MWVIKNRITNEYDYKGMRGKRNTVARAAWATLGQAKNHVALCLPDEWYLEADFIECGENGVEKILPVVEYIVNYFDAKYANWPHIPKRHEDFIEAARKYL